MNNSIINFIKKYKLFLIPLIPLLIYMLTFFLPEASEKESVVTSSAIPTPVSSTSSPTSAPIITPFVDFGEDADFYETEIDEPLEERPDFLKKEPAKGTLSDGTVVYTFKSTNSARPNIIITQGGEDIVFQRTVTDPAYPLTISDYTDVDGEPDKISPGSRFYGADKQIYIYERKGVAFIADPKTKQILEQHFFLPMPSDEYLKRYTQ